MEKSVTFVAPNDGTAVGVPILVPAHGDLILCDGKINLHTVITITKNVVAHFFNACGQVDGFQSVAKAEGEVFYFTQ